LKILIVGFGSIAKRHLTNLSAVAPDAQLALLRLHNKSVDLGVHALEVQETFFDLDDAIAWQPDMALLTNPAPFHVPAGLRLASTGCHLFIEKPIGTKEDEVKELIGVCREFKVVLMVGYVLRFARWLRVIKETLVDGAIGKPMMIRAEVGQYLPDWRTGVDYRQSVSARRYLGGGAIFELSHEIDYVCWLMGEVDRVTAIAECSGELEVDVEDMAEIGLHFRSGCVGSIHLDMLQRTPVRGGKVVGSEGAIVWNGITREVELFKPGVENRQLIYRESSADARDMYLDEMSHFLDCIQTNRDPLVGGKDGLRALQIALAAKKSTIEERTVAV
jgi:predicted dehydrogenase